LIAVLTELRKMLDLANALELSTLTAMPIDKISG
jgi:hypothetical protein